VKLAVCTHQAMDEAGDSRAWFIDVKPARGIVECGTQYS